MSYYKTFFISNNFIVNLWNIYHNASSAFQACLCVPQVPLCDVVDPPDYEEFLNANFDQAQRDPIHHLLEFPHDDIEVGILPRKCRTVLPVFHEGSIDDLEPHIRNSLCHYSSDWIVVNRRYFILLFSLLKNEEMSPWIWIWKHDLYYFIMSPAMVSCFHIWSQSGSV